jgi:hypothetical protein
LADAGMNLAQRMSSGRHEHRAELQQEHEKLLAKTI